MQEQQINPITGAYWVKYGKLLAGKYPGAFAETMLKTELHRLLEIGVTFFADLTEEWEKGLKPYNMLLEEQADVLETSIEYRRMPFPDFGTPTAEEMRHILGTINNALEAGHIVYFHCFAGIGRTGTVAGCYLAEQGFAGENALDELLRLRQGTDFEGMESPITPEQRQMVVDWSPA